MAQISRQVGTTSQVTLLFIQDSSSTTGAGLTGLAYNTGSLTCYYKRSNGTASVAVTLANITTLGTYVSGGFKEVDATNLPGVYEFHPPDAALASGADSVAFLLKGATNMAPCPLVIELTGTSNQDATAGGISRLDAAVSSRMATYTQPTGFLTATFPTTVASTTNITGGTITTVGTTTNLTNLPSIPANWLTAAGIASGALDGKGNWNVGKTGYSLTATTGLGNQTADITGSLSGSVGSVTGNVGGNVAGSVGSISGVSFPSGFSTLTTATIADQVWDEILSGHAGVGSAGAALAAAGGSGDPWSTALPGAYGAGTAGYLVGTYLDAAVSTRSTYAGADTSGTTTLLSRVTAAVALAGSAPSWYATTGLKLASDGLDSITIDASVNARQAISLIASATAGTVSGNDTNSPVFKGINTNTTRITATTTTAGNRTAVTLSPPA